MSVGQTLALAASLGVLARNSQKRNCERRMSYEL